jgi:serine/threonine protein phosphatase 1
MFVNFEQKAYPKGNLYAIGDVHGCLNALKLLIDKLIKEESFGFLDQIVFVGDYIDRGASSKGVIEYLIEFKKAYPNTEFLRGNHEDMFLGFFTRKGMYGEYYLHNGGTEVLKEYKLDKYAQQKMSGVSYKIPKEQIYEKIPQAHREFVEATKFALEFSDIIFVHGGLNIHKPIDKQTYEDVVWMRDPFLGSEHKFGKWVVHGHTPCHEVYFNKPYEINLDTGCVFGDEIYGGTLSCIKFDLGDIMKSEIISVKNPDPGY